MRTCSSGRCACVTRCRWRRRTRWTASRGASIRAGPPPSIYLPHQMRWRWWREWRGKNAGRNSFRLFRLDHQHCFFLNWGEIRFQIFKLWIKFVLSGFPGWVTPTWDWKRTTWRSSTKTTRSKGWFWPQSLMLGSSRGKNQLSVFLLLLYCWWFKKRCSVNLPYL